MNNFKIPTRLRHPTVALAVLKVLKNSGELLKAREISRKISGDVGNGASASVKRVASYCDTLPQVCSEKDNGYNVYGFNGGSSSEQ